MFPCRNRGVIMAVPPSSIRRIGMMMIPSLTTPTRRTCSAIAISAKKSTSRCHMLVGGEEQQPRSTSRPIHSRPFIMTLVSDKEQGSTSNNKRPHESSVFRRERGRTFSTAAPSPVAGAMEENMTDNTTTTSSSKNILHPVAVKLFLKNLQRAAAWNHGQEGAPYDRTLWDPTFCRSVVDRYESYLQLLIDMTANESSYNNNKNSGDAKQQLLSAETVNLALKALLKGHYEPPELSHRVREWEIALGHLKQTPLTDALSFGLIAANGKSGNVGRVLSLLQLRKQRNYKPKRREFEYAIRSLQASQWAQRRSRRNPFASDAQQAALDNPTRWLDAILINMHERGFPLTTALANQMLNCYAGGPTGKAVHHFYRVVRRPITSLPPEERPVHVENMPMEWVYVRDDEYDGDDDGDDGMSDTDEEGEGNETTMASARATGKHAYLPIRTQLEYHRIAPPFYKVPTQVRGKLLPSTKPLFQQGQFKLEKESETEYSYPLAAAFAFCDSLQHGACGHPGIELNVHSYNALIKACVHRGALWRAMHLIDETMPCPPNTMSFNLILTGLARVGDVHMAQDYYMKLLAAGLSPDAFTVRAIVDGMLNLGDIPGAVTVVQDFFNQHCVLPPYTTHLKILEFCLGRDMVYEAKRYVWFLQQLWVWKPNTYHTEDFIKLMRATQQNEQLQREALEQLFAYFGEKLEDTDFL